jgi:hypothetical protein
VHPPAGNGHGATQLAGGSSAMTTPVGDSSAAGWTAVAVAATAATTAAATCALLWLRPHSGGDGGGGTAPTRLSVRIGTGTTPVPYREPCWMTAAARRLGWRDYQPPAAKLRLGHLPTPLHRWELPGTPDSCEVWIKRDDCTGSELSGNKIRKLEFLLAEALESGCDTVITVGGIQSNHCRATAAAARRLGLIPHIILRTVDPSSDPGLVGNLMVDRMVGAEIHLVGEEEFAKKGGWGLVCELREKLTREEGRKVYAFPSGQYRSSSKHGLTPPPPPLPLHSEVGVFCARVHARVPRWIQRLGRLGIH